MIKGRTSLPVAVYLRVSQDSQTTENQRIALQAAAQARGWNVVHVYQDQGISGAKGRDKRPGLDALLKDAAKGDFKLVAAWSVDRLGRSLQDLISFLNELQALGVDLLPIVLVMIRLSRQALSTFWADAGKAMLVTAVPCLVLDWIVLDPTRVGMFTVFLATAGVVLVPLTLFTIASLALFLFRRPGWLLGPAIMVVANSAFVDFVR